MKWKSIIAFAVIITLAFTACKKETTDDISTVVKVSYPAIELIGPEIVVLPVGATYTDNGATLTDDITGDVTNIEPSSSNVNTAEPGLYVVSFSASNSNGFQTVANRLVAVTSVTGTTDRSGTYLREATGSNCYITRVEEGVYKVENPGGAPTGTGIAVYYVETALNEYICPSQPSTEGPFGVINIAFTATGATWNIVNAGYGTAQRVFVKQ